jgi:hypothetical protein
VKARIAGTKRTRRGQDDPRSVFIYTKRGKDLYSGETIIHAIPSDLNKANKPLTKEERTIMPARISMKSS